MSSAKAVQSVRKELKVRKRDHPALFMPLGLGKIRIKGFRRCHKKCLDGSEVLYLGLYSLSAVCGRADFWTVLYEPSPRSSAARSATRPLSLKKPLSQYGLQYGRFGQEEDSLKALAIWGFPKIGTLI